MYFLLVGLVTISCIPSDAATTTKINYLPNGQVAGYQLIINNTVEPSGNHPLPRDRVSKILRQTSKIGNTFTTVDERVVGENSYLNVHTVLKQHQARMKYPLKNVLMVPSVRYKDGVAENVKLRFAQIGPYAALIVPVDKSERNNLGNADIRDSVKTYVEVQEPTPKSTRETGYVYAPPTDNESPAIDIKSLATFNEKSVPSANDKKDQYNYKYPAATTVASSQSPRKGGPNNNQGFILRVANPTKGDSQDSPKEFFVPADPNLFAPERDDKIIANPFKYTGSSDNPNSSQFKEVYNKVDPSADEFSAGQKDPVIPSQTIEDKSDVGSNDPPPGVGSQSDQFKSQTQSSQHIGTSWSLSETKDQFGYPIGGPPPGQPEFSDVAPPADSEQSSGDQSGSANQSQNTDENSGLYTASIDQRSRSESGPERTSVSASASASTESIDQRFQGFNQQSVQEGSTESVNEGHQIDYKLDQSTHVNEKSDSTAGAHQLDHQQENSSSDDLSISQVETSNVGSAPQSSSQLGQERNSVFTSTSASTDATDQRFQGFDQGQSVPEGSTESVNEANQDSFEQSTHLNEKLNSAAGAHPFEHSQEDNSSSDALPGLIERQTIQETKDAAGIRQQSGTDSGPEQTPVPASASASADSTYQRFQGFTQGLSTHEKSSTESLNETPQNNYNVELSTPLIDSATAAQIDNFHEEMVGSAEQAVDSDQQFSGIQGTQSSFSKNSGKSSTLDSVQQSNRFQGTTSGSNDKAYAVSSGSDEQRNRFGQISSQRDDEDFGTFQGAAIQNLAQQSITESYPPNIQHQSNIKFQGTSDAETAAKILNEQSNHQFGRIQSKSGQNDKQVTNPGSASAVSTINDRNNQFQLQNIGLSSDDSNLDRFHTIEGQNFGNFASTGSFSTVKNQPNKFQVQNIGLPSDDSNSNLERFQTNGKQNFGNFANTGSFSSVYEQPNRFQGLFTPNLGHISSGDSSSAAYSRLHVLKQTPRIHPIPNSLGLSTSAGLSAAKIISSERLRKLINDPSLNTQLNFLSPDGRTTAVLTTAGNSAVVQLPSNVPQHGQPNGKIVIPEVNIPLSITTKVNEAGALENTGPVPLLGQHFNGFGPHTQHGLVAPQDTSSNAAPFYQEHQLGNAFGSTPDYSRPVSHFDATGAVAAAAAAVSSDNEHFLHFDNTEIPGSKQSLGLDDSRIQPLITYNRVNAQSFNEQPNSNSKQPIAINFNGDKKDYDEKTYISEARPSGYSSVEHLAQTGNGVNIKGDDFSQFLIDTSGRITTRFGAGAAHSQQNTQWAGSDTHSANQRIEGGSSLLPGSALLPISHSVNEQISSSGKEPTAINFTGDKKEYKEQTYSSEAGPSGQSSFQHFAQSGNGVNIRGDDFSQFLIDTSGRITAGFGAGATQTQQNTQWAGSEGHGANQRTESGSSPFLGGASLPVSHSVNGGAPEVAAKNTHKIVIPNYSNPTPNRAGIPIQQFGTSRQLQYTSRFGSHPTPTTNNQHPGTVVSHSSHAVGPHTEQLLETLNGIITHPRRHVTEPNAT